MAILRGGRRIGNYDIRLGIPRDRSLDNVEGDKRLKRVQGPTPESTIGRVMGVHKVKALQDQIDLWWILFYQKV